MTNNTNKLIVGEVQNIRGDSKAIQINNEWYSGFKILRFKKGDIIEIEYFVNAKGFNQIYSSKLIPINEDFTKIHKNNIKENTLLLIKSDNNLDHVNTIIPDTTKNTILMLSKDIYLDQKDIPLEEITKKLLECYELITQYSLTPKEKEK